MRKSLIDPEIGNELLDDSSSVDELAYSGGVVAHCPGFKRLYLSGIVSDDPGDGEDLRAQTRTALSTIERYLAEHDGSMRDVVRMEIFVAAPHLTTENLEAVHEIRLEFFETEYPASTVVEVADLVRDHAMIEFQIDAIIPDEGWD
ncbi:RidA family protein [Halobacteriales archaeon Cl-PHB]